MKRQHVLVVALFCIAFLMPGTVRDGYAQNDNYLSRATLKGLTGVEVIVEPMRPEIEETGLSQTMLQTVTELTLREAGVPVVSQPEASLTTGGLYLNVDCMIRPPIMVYGCSLRVELLQPATLVRNPKIVVAAASTWSVGEIYMVGSAYLSRDVPNAVQDLVKQFANVYLEQNPRNP